MQDKHATWAAAAETTTAAHSSSNTTGMVTGKLFSSRRLECRAWFCGGLCNYNQLIVDVGARTGIFAG